MAWSSTPLTGFSYTQRYVYVDLHGLAESGEDLDEVQLPVESAEDGSHLGYLIVTLHISDILKHLATPWVIRVTMSFR